MPHDHSHSHGHSHGHGHGHHHIDPESGDRRVAGAIAVNLGLTVVQIVAGIFSGSLALIADAIHNLSDALSLVIAFAARRIARRGADEKMTFGYGRAEVVAALINYTTLIVIALYLAAEAVQRFFDPLQVEGWTVVIVAGVALVIDTVTALLVFAMSKDSMNIRAAFLHNVADAMGSVAVIVGGVLILVFGWWIVDPIVTLMISAYILWHSWHGIRPVIGVLMLAAPDSPELEDVVGSLRDIDGVADIHHVHLWRMQESEVALEAHVVLDESRDPEEVKLALKRELEESFDISHAVLELESRDADCGETRLIGH